MPTPSFTAPGQKEQRIQDMIRRSLLVAKDRGMPVGDGRLLTTPTLEIFLSQYLLSLAKYPAAGEGFSKLASEHSGRRQLRKPQVDF